MIHMLANLLLNIGGGRNWHISQL